MFWIQTVYKVTSPDDFQDIKEIVKQILEGLNIATASPPLMDP